MLSKNVSDVKPWCRVDSCSIAAMVYVDLIMVIIVFNYYYSEMIAFSIPM